jgi:hypothetical protein
MPAVILVIFVFVKALWNFPVHTGVYFPQVSSLFLTSAGVCICVNYRGD